MDDDVKTQNSANISDQMSQADQFFLDYQDTIIKGMGLDRLPEEDKKPLRERITILVNKRLINALLMNLPSEKAKSYEDKMESATPDEIIDYLMENVPEAEEKIASELKDLKEELIGPKSNE